MPSIKLRPVGFLLRRSKTGYNKENEVLFLPTSVPQMLVGGDGFLFYLKLNKGV